MRKVLAFTGSNSSISLNKQLLDYTMLQFSKAQFNIINLEDYNIPIYSEDIEKETGIPASVMVLKEMFSAYDAFVIASPEHNGYPSAFLKNILDWLSRIDRYTFGKKSPVLLLSTSPGAGGGGNNLNHLAVLVKYGGGSIIDRFSLRSLNDNFHDGRIIDKAVNAELFDAIDEFKGYLK